MGTIAGGVAGRRGGAARRGRRHREADRGVCHHAPDWLRRHGSGLRGGPRRRPVPETRRPQVPPPRPRGRPRHPPLPLRAPDPRQPQSQEHRRPPRWRRDPRRAALHRHGVRRRAPHHHLRRPAPPRRRRPRPAPAPGLRRRPARPPEPRRPPRPQAGEHPRHPDGTVKLLDFGIARLLREGEGPDQLPPTQGGLHAFTPDYASPEQVRGLPVATPSDLYSLGVIACELLAGQRPFDFDSKLFAEMQAMIAMAPAPAPSTLVTSASAASMGEGDATRLQRRLAGDLDAIVLQALRKEPERRYGSAEQLGEDLRRYLEGLPVTARRDTLGYRTRKFLRRHRVEVAAGLLVVASLVGGIVATTRQARRAQLERGKMEQVNEFLATMLSAVDPGYSGRDVTVAQVLTQAAADIGGQALDPEIEAELRQTIGQTFYGLAMYDSASTHVERAYALRRGRYGELDQRTAQSFSTRVNLAEARSEFAVAESLARVDVDHQRRMPRGQQNAAALATALDNLARMVEQRGRLDEAMAIKLESIGIRRVEGDSASMSTLPYALNNLAVSYEYKGEHARADSLMREALAVERRIRGPESVYAGNIMRAYASLRDDMGDRAGADSLMRESLRILRAALGPTHADYLRTVSMLAQLRYSANDMEGTITYAREVAAQIGKGLHEGEPSAATTMQALGLALDSLHQFAAADSALARALELRRKFLPADHWLIPNAEAVYGYHLGRVGRNAEAERILRAAYERMAQLRGADAAPTKRVAVRLAELMEKLGRTDDARRWRAKG
ncbi:MAG: tetratricopeptide repeat protein [Gemmatimonadetes bacterium]|nr:tetratricopeptide repeat protein [Gemmatimonadota bacterium]